MKNNMGLLSSFVLLALSVGFVTLAPHTEIQIDVNGPMDHCSCTAEPVPQCGCCFEFKVWRKQHSVCANLTYVRDEKALAFSVTLDGKVIINKTVSAVNPPPFCRGVPPLPYICVKFYNMSYGDDDRWGGCLTIYGKAVMGFRLDVGCIYLPGIEENEELKWPSCYPELLKPANKGSEMEDIQKVLLEIFNGNLLPEGEQADVINTIPVNQ